MNNWYIIDFSRIFLLGILIFKGLTARHLYKSFGVKGLIYDLHSHYKRLETCSVIPTIKHEQRERERETNGKMDTSSII
jgi:hypothetical protein